ncbi:uncharacterized protein UHOD_03322 [Ustilago sp. UG-2017b]|nr:uncharacterized protein UHOD_03322 [Ustilago sp. UG-2017b]
MRITTSLTTLVLLALAATHTASASSSPRAEEEHKFIKRSPRGHGGGSGWGKTIVGGTVLAGTGAFAATAGSMAAHHVFGDHDEKESRSEGGSEGGRNGSGQQASATVYTHQPVVQQPVVQQPPAQQTNSGGGGGDGEAPFPIGILMSNGATVPIPEKLLQSAFAQQQVLNTGGGGIVYPHY